MKRLAAAITLSALSSLSWAENLPTIKVFKSESCMCCVEWVEHLEENGFTVETQNVTDINTYKFQANLPYDMASCHTGFIGDYAVEGHVPAADVKRLLAEKPDVRGIAVLGMPVGSPGMEYGDRKDPYQVISYTDQGEKAVFATY